MIRINLLKSQMQAVQPERLAALVDEPPKGRARRAFIALLVLLIVCMTVYLVIYVLRLSEKVAVASAPAATTTSTPAKPVENPKTTSVDTTSAVQAATLFHLLRDLETAATTNTGFSSVEFSSPDFKVHGIAASDNDLKHFQNALSGSTGTEINEGQIQSVKTDSTAQEFFYTGDVHYAALKNDFWDNTLSADQIAAETQAFSSLARAQSVDLEPLPLADSSMVNGKHLVSYQAVARCDYAQMENLLDKLKTAKSNTGFRHFVLEARGNEKMSARFDLVFILK